MQISFWNTTVEVYVDGSNAISFDEYDSKDFAFWVNGFDRREKKIWMYNKRILLLRQQKNVG